MLTYVLGGISLTLGLLAAVFWTIVLAHPLGRLRRVTRIRAATSSAARRRVRRNLASSLGLALLGALVLFSATSLTIGWLALGAGVALAVWQFGPPLAARVRRA
ncbi:MAG: hypothetical protein JO016_10215 [Actinobacteria bacterium]|nr:hypothetical protein [Actinomycetota bacterium]